MKRRKLALSIGLAITGWTCFSGVAMAQVQGAPPAQTEPVRVHTIETVIPVNLHDKSYAVVEVQVEEHDETPTAWERCPLSAFQAECPILARWFGSPQPPQRVRYLQPVPVASLESTQPSTQELPEPQAAQLQFQSWVPQESQPAVQTTTPHGTTWQWQSTPVVTQQVPANQATPVARQLTLREWSTGMHRPSVTVQAPARAAGPTYSYQLIESNNVTRDVTNLTVPAANYSVAATPVAAEFRDVLPPVQAPCVQPARSSQLASACGTAVVAAAVCQSCDQATPVTSRMPLPRSHPTSQCASSTCAASAPWVATQACAENAQSCQTTSVAVPCADCPASCQQALAHRVSQGRFVAQSADVTACPASCGEACEGSCPAAQNPLAINIAVRSPEGLQQFALPVPPHAPRYAPAQSLNANFHVARGHLPVGTVLPSPSHRHPAPTPPAHFSEEHVQALVDRVRLETENKWLRRESEFRIESMSQQMEAKTEMMEAYVELQSAYMVEMAEAQAEVVRLQQSLETAGLVQEMYAEVFAAELENAKLRAVLENAEATFTHASHEHATQADQKIAELVSRLERMQHENAALHEKLSAMEEKMRAIAEQPSASPIR